MLDLEMEVNGNEKENMRKKMKYQHILFDLDGTLTDSAEGITKSTAHALKHFNIEVEDLSSLNKFIGPKLQDSFMEYYDFTEEQADLAAEIFRQRFAKIGKFENKLYAGIKELLEKLKTSGRKLYVATSKPMVYSKEILDYFSISQYFEDIVGCELDGTRTDKSEVIAYTIEKNGISKAERLVMVGDRKFDVLGAKENGLPVIGVLYGFGSRQELTESGADRLAEDLAELEKMLLEEK